MITQKIINTVEALLFGSGRPLRLSEIKALLEIDLGQLELSAIKMALNDLEERYRDSSLELKEVASGYRLQVKQEYSSCLASLWIDKSNKLSKSSMPEPLSLMLIIALLAVIKFNSSCGSGVLEVASNEFLIRFINTCSKRI